MTSARLLAFALVLSPVCAFSQDQLPNNSSLHDEARPSADFQALPELRSEGRNFFIDGPEIVTHKSPFTIVQTDQFKVDQNQPFNLMAPNDQIALNPEAQPIDTTVCFKMRSYVVARDNKSSDSTHPVGYTTCTPGARVGVKKVATPGTR